MGVQPVLQLFIFEAFNVKDDSCYVVVNVAGISHKTEAKGGVNPQFETLFEL